MTAKSEVTDWFTGDVFPVRPGLYERNYGAYTKLDTFGFNGKVKFWMCVNNDVLRPYGVPWRGLTKPHCQKCGTKMITSKAIAQTYTGQFDFLGDEHPVTMSPGGKGKMIDCYKCPSCGWSITK